MLVLFDRLALEAKFGFKLCGVVHALKKLCGMAITVSVILVISAEFGMRDLDLVNALIKKFG